MSDTSKHMSQALEQTAEDLYQPEEVPHVPKTRACLMCHTRFESAWAGERICPRCKSSTQWRSGLS